MQYAEHGGRNNFFEEDNAHLDRHMPGGAFGGLWSLVFDRFVPDRLETWGKGAATEAYIPTQRPPRFVSLETFWDEGVFLLHAASDLHDILSITTDHLFNLGLRTLTFFREIDMSTF